MTRRLCLAGVLCLAVGCGPGKHADGTGVAESAPPSAGINERSTVTRDVASDSPIEQLLAATSMRSAWYGLYMLDKKVGHARIWLRAATDEEEGRLVVGTDAELSVQGPGQTTTVSIDERRYYDGTAPYALRMTELSETSQGLTTLRRAVRDGDGMRLTTPGQPDPVRRLPATAETVHSVLAMSPLDFKALAPGKAVEVSVFDWESLADQVVAVTLKGMSTLQRSGVTTPVAELEIQYKGTGLKGISLIGEDGVALRTTLGAGLVLKLEEETVAKARVVGLDVVASGVPVARRLVAPAEHDALTVTVTLAEGATLPTGPGQHVTREGPKRLKLRLDRSVGAEVTAAERAEFLSPRGAVNSEHPDIQAQALALTAGLKTEREKAQALLKWVHRTLKKKLATHIPSASQVLERRVGDCTEHTWLFVALARAAGVPAKPVYGLMYIDDVAPSFGYHAWADVSIDGRWIAVDPTWGQLPADATHIRVGDDAVAVASVMGGLSIALPDAPTGGPPNAP
ncbi:MAG: transglutaminase-like domain-containing protein [Myxococcota bacterium]